MLNDLDRHKIIKERKKYRVGRQDNDFNFIATNNLKDLDFDGRKDQTLTQMNISETLHQQRVLE